MCFESSFKARQVIHSETAGTYIRSTLLCRIRTGIPRRKYPVSGGYHITSLRQVQTKVFNSRRLNGSQLIEALWRTTSTGTLFPDLILLLLSNTVMQLVQERRRAPRSLRSRRPMPSRFAEDFIHLVRLVPVGRRVFVHGVLHPAGQRAEAKHRSDRVKTRFHHSSPRAKA